MRLRVLTFASRPGVARERQDEVLADIRAWKGIDSAGRMMSGAEPDSLSRHCYAYIQDSACAGNLIESLAQLPEIESASEPSGRFLQ